MPPWLLVGAAQLVIFVPIALLRYVDVDEGYYLAAAVLVLDGERPYVDFFYQQMPLFPYVYGAWAELVGESWFRARLLSAICATAAGVLLFEHVRRRRGILVASSAVVLYATSTLVLAWLPLAKTYALTTLLLVAAYVAVDRGDLRHRHAVGAGLLVGLAIDVRLLFAAVVPAFVWHVARHESSAAPARLRVGTFAGGLGLGLLPSLVFFALDPERFWFDNVGAHAVRSSEGLVGDLGQKARLIESLLGIGTPAGAEPQFVLLVAGGVAATAVAVRARRLPLALGIAALISLASILPTPAYPQYFCVAVPFLAVATAEALGGLRRLAVPLGAVLALYVAIGLAVSVRTVRMFPDQRIAAVEEVADAIDARTRPGERVVVSWAGYLFGTHARPAPGSGNDFEPRFAAALAPHQARYYRLTSAVDVERAIASGEARVIVVKRWHDLAPLPRWEQAAARSGYRRVATIAPEGRAEIGGPVVIYERRP